MNYSVGDLGPAGGYIIYDCDADNVLGNLDGLISSECGWRFIEVAPEDISLNGNDTFVFGYYRARADGKNLYTSGKSDYEEGTSLQSDGKSTGNKVGTGYANTIKLVKTMFDSAYIESSGTETTGDYAANICYKSIINGYDDWFLPSYDELYLMYSILFINGKGNFTAIKSSDGYWSSSEFSYWGNPDARCLHFLDPEAKVYDNGRGSKYFVRPVRYF